MIVITVPLIFPILARYGIDPIWFGVILVVFVEIGQISPPIGINLFVIQSIWDGKLSEVVIGTIPFHLLMFVIPGAAHSVAGAGAVAAPAHDVPSGARP